jgi:hypothetical protein
VAQLSAGKSGKGTRVPLDKSEGSVKGIVILGRGGPHLQRRDSAQRGDRGAPFLAIFEKWGFLRIASIPFPDFWKVTPVRL